MSRLHFFVFLFSFSILSVYPQWRFYEVDDPIDGLYIYGRVVGTSNDSTYRNPLMFIQKTANKYDFNIFFGGIGFTGCSYASLTIVFPNNSEIFEFDSDSNLDNDVAFVELPSLNPNKYSFRYIPILNDVTRSGPSEDELTKFKKLMYLLETEEKVYVRYKSRCGSIDMEFSLDGSQDVINKILANQLNDLEDYFKNEEKRVFEEYISKKREIEYKDSIKAREAQIRDSISQDEEIKEKIRDSINYSLELKKRAHRLKPFDEVVTNFISNYNSSAKATIIPLDNMVKYEIQNEKEISITETKVLNDKNKIKEFKDKVRVFNGSIIWVYPSPVGKKFKVVVSNSLSSNNPSFYFGLLTPKAISLLETKPY